MTQNEHLIWLIEYLLSERRDSDSATVPQSEDEKFQLYRSLVNVRLPQPITDEYLKIQDEYLQELLRKRGSVQLSDMECIYDNL